MEVRIISLKDEIKQLLQTCLEDHYYGISISTLFKHRSVSPRRVKIPVAYESHARSLMLCWHGQNRNVRFTERLAHHVMYCNVLNWLHSMNTK